MGSQLAQKPSDGIQIKQAHFNRGTVFQHCEFQIMQFRKEKIPLKKSNKPKSQS